MHQSVSSTSAVLDKLVLFAATTRIIGVEREAGSTRDLGVSRKAKEIQSVINPKRLSGFKQIKSELFRLCRSYGTKIDVLDAWGVPEGDDADLLSVRLTQMANRWNELTDEIVLRWDDWVTEWANKNPDYAAEIRRLAPNAKEVKKKTKFVFASYRLTPDQIQSGSLDSEFDNLHEQAVHEIAAYIREAYQDIESETWGSKVFRAVSVRTVLSSVARKAQGLGFLHPQVAAIPGVIESVLSQLPTNGSIAGLQAIGLRTLLEQLTQPRLVIDGGIILPCTSVREQREIEVFDNLAYKLPDLGSIIVPPPLASPVAVAGYDW